MKQNPPKTTGRPRKQNYDEVRELWKIRQREDPSVSKAQVARDLGISPKTLRYALSGLHLEDEVNRTTTDARTHSTSQGSGLVFTWGINFYGP